MRWNTYIFHCLKDLPYRQFRIVRAAIVPFSLHLELLYKIYRILHVIYQLSTNQALAQAVRPGIASLLVSIKSQVFTLVCYSSA